MKTLSRKLLIVIMIIACTATVGWTQISSGGGRISFKELNHDFGIFHEGGDAGWDFLFTNTGSDTLSITSVHAQCGCTTPSYNHKQVAPGQQGKITVVYHSAFRPGPFQKEIVVTTDGTPATVKVRIKGNVLPKPLKGQDVTLIGGLRFSDGTIHLDRIPREKPVKYVLHFQNASPHPIRILKLIHPQDVEAYYPPFTILTGELMRVTMTFIPGKTRSYGLVRDSLIFKTNDPEKPDKVIYFTARVVPDKGTISQSGPELVFQRDFIDLGTVLQHDTVKVAYPFVNKGPDTLAITDLQTSCGCTTADLKKEKFAPGESGMIHVALNAGDKFGEIQKEIMVRSNDQLSPQMQLLLRAKVVRHPDGIDKMGAMKNQGSIFRGKCRSCHVDKGLGKKGEALFAADCQLCHGPAGKKDSIFHPGPSLNHDFLSTFDGTVLFKRIAKGTPEPHKRHMMPGFLEKFGGPLTREQVYSLVHYLQTVQHSN